MNIFVKSAGIPLNVFDQVNPFWYACVIFTLNTAALLSEVFRSAILSIPSGQMEAGLSVGLTRWQTYRKIILPQAMSVAVPSICNITVNLIKGTSLAFLMGVKDILAVAKIQASYGYNYIEAYLDVFLVYIILCTVIQLFFRYAEKWRAITGPHSEEGFLLLTVHHIAKSFHGKPVLKDISMEVSKGDVIVILGPSGSGKTTFLRCLNFLEKADKGSMDFGEKHMDMEKVSPQDIAYVRKHTAFVFQNYNLFANQTVLKNVTIGLTIGRGMKTSEAYEIGRSALQRWEWPIMNHIILTSYPAGRHRGWELREPWLSARMSSSSMNLHRLLIRNGLEKCLAS